MADADLCPGTELAEQVKTGAEKIISQDGESYVALIDDARRGLEDIVAGRTQEADAAIAKLQKRRSVAARAAGATKKRG